MVAKPVVVAWSYIIAARLHSAVLSVGLYEEVGIVDIATDDEREELAADNDVVETCPLAFVAIGAFGSVAPCGIGGNVGHVFAAQELKA